jgi:hypothetical protein
MPEIAELYWRYHDRGFEILGLAKEIMADDVRAYVGKNRLPWPQAMQGLDGPALKAYRIDGIPTTVLVDREGRIAARELRGEVLASAVAQQVEAPAECSLEGLWARSPP